MFLLCVACFGLRLRPEIERERHTCCSHLVVTLEKVFRAFELSHASKLHWEGRTCSTATSPPSP